MNDNSDSGYCAVFKFNDWYRICYGDSHDTQREFVNKLDALLAARKAQKDRNRDENFILDLTDLNHSELRLLGFIP